MRKIKYNPDDLVSFDDEWGLHKGCREWWYATGIMFDEDNRMYSWQYTLLNLAFGLVTKRVAMIALTDFENDRHYYLQKKAKRSRPVYIDRYEASMGDIATVKREPGCISFDLNHKDFNLTLYANYGKGRVWHCDHGKLQMGIPDKNATTFYYSWTNMPTSGTLMLNGVEHNLRGQTWFDKQGGTYNMANMKCHWEWFSIRFFDDEEAMLFTFNENNPPYQDGTFIPSSGRAYRMNNYHIERTATTECNGLIWSNGWKLHMEEKEKDYIIEPFREGHMNFAYFEELCSVKTLDGRLVGFAFAELLPGVLNKQLLSKGGGNISMKNLFKDVEI